MRTFATRSTRACSRTSSMRWCGARRQSTGRSASGRTTCWQTRTSCRWGQSAGSCAGSGAGQCVGKGAGKGAAVLWRMMRGVGPRAGGRGHHACRGARCAVHTLGCCAVAECGVVIVVCGVVTGTVVMGRACPQACVLRRLHRAFGRFLCFAEARQPGVPPPAPVQHSKHRKIATALTRR